MIAATERLPRRLWPAVVLLAAVGVSASAWMAWPGRARPPAPPDLPSGEIHPELAAAIAEARRDIEANPHSDEAWGILGKILLANGRGPEAEICFHQAEKLNDKNPRWPYFLAIALLKVDGEEAIACLRRASERCDRFDPAVLTPHLQLATLLIEEGRHDEARELLRIVRAKQPDNAHTLYLTGVLLASVNDLRGAIALLRLLADNRAARQKVSAKLAQLHLRLGETQAAEKWNKLARSLPEDVLWPDPYGLELRSFILGREQRLKEAERLVKEGRFTEAVELLKQMIENNETPLDPIYVSLGNSFVRLGRGPEAENAYEEALRLSPHDAETCTRLAVVRLLQGEVRENRFKDRAGAMEHYQRAVAAARDAVAINPLLAEGHTTLGQALLYVGQRSQGIASLRAALKIRPELANAHLLLGEALAEDGQFVEARNHLRDAIRFADPTDPRPRQALEKLEKKAGPQAPP